MYPNCNHPKFTNQICNVSPMRSIGRIHAGYILNVPHFSDVIALCPKWGRSIKLGTLRSHDWVHSKSDQHFSQEQIKTTFMGTFSINPTFAHWAHWSHLLSVLPMYPACAWWVFGSLSPVTRDLGFAAPSSRRSFRSARFSVPGPDKVAFSRLLSRVARLDHTGDKDQNTHQPHAGYIGSTDNK